MTEPDKNDPAGARREWTVFILLAFVLAPVISVFTVSGFGFAVWAWQMIAGPPGPPPP